MRRPRAAILVWPCEVTSAVGLAYLLGGAGFIGWFALLPGPFWARFIVVVVWQFLVMGLGLHAGFGELRVDHDGIVVRRRLTGGEVLVLRWAWIERVELVQEGWTAEGYTVTRVDIHLHDDEIETVRGQYRTMLSMSTLAKLNAEGFVVPVPVTESWDALRIGSSTAE